MTDTHVLAMRPCPQCECLGIVEVHEHWHACPLCGGDRYVSHFKAATWELEQGKTEPPPP